MTFQQSEQYWDTRAEGYSKIVHRHLAGKESAYFSRVLRECLPPVSRPRCLDLGCGPGFFSILLAREGLECVAVDGSPEMLAQARQNFAECGVSAEACLADVTELPFPDESFDYIVSRNLVWNLEDPMRAYQDWLRVLKPGGTILVADANHYLYYYDKEYAEARMRGTNREPQNLYGVDPTPINSIARDLPLSRMHRPVWDIRCLHAQGADTVELCRLETCTLQRPDGSRKYLPMHFVIAASKAPVQEAAVQKPIPALLHTAVL